MGSNSQKAVKTMAEEIARALKNYTNANNQRYVNKQINNAIANAGVGSSSGGGVMPGYINASQVRGLYNTVAGYIINASQASAQGDEIAGQIISTLSGIADVELSHATIDTAQIRNLYASYGDFIELVAQHATIQGVDVEEIYADIAEIGISDIGTANIGYAQIKDLVAGTTIFRDGIGGQLFIDRLNVTEANILDLSVGTLMIRDSNGEMVELYVDGQGQVQTREVKYDGDDIINTNSLNGSTLTSGTVAGGKLMANTINARELNVSAIFADNALIGAIKAANIDVADLFADNGFIGSLYTYVISSPVGDDIDISGNSSITLTNDRLDLMVSDQSTSSQIILTNSMINAIASAVSLRASTIDLSANTSITSLVTATNTLNDEINNQSTGLKTRVTQTESSITAMASDIDDLDNPTDGRVTVLETDVSGISSTVYDSNTGISKLNQRAGSLEAIVGNGSGLTTDLTVDVTGIKAIVGDGTGLTADLTLDVTGLSSTVYDPSTGLSSVKQTADKITWVISGNSIGSMALTSDAATLIFDSINANANNINLSANNTILMSSGDDTVGLRRVLRLNNDGLHVGDSETDHEVLLNSDGMDVVINNIAYSRFAATFAQFGLYQIRKDHHNGLVFKLGDPLYDDPIDGPDVGGE